MSSKLGELFGEFGVTTESALLEELFKEDYKIPCIICGVEYSIDQLSFDSDDPVCIHCLGG